jgi:hypothetical protein
MRLCADENIGRETVLRLREAGHDVLWIREAAPGLVDLEVLKRASLEQRLLLTFDKDFGDLAYRLGADAPAGIESRKHPQPPWRRGSYLFSIPEAIGRGTSVSWMTPQSECARFHQSEHRTQP